METETETLEKMCSLIVDCPHSTPVWTDEGCIVLRNQNIRGGRLDLSSPSFTDEEHYKGRTKRAVPRAGDLVFTREAPMGEICMLPENLTCCLGQRQVLLRPKDDVDRRYLLYAIQSPYVQHQILWNEGTGSTVSNVRIPVLKQIKIPRLDAESETADILGTLDDKIELNRRMNRTLEAIAQAIFKSWFVDFEPVRAKAAAKAAGASPATIERAAMAAIAGRSIEDGIARAGYFDDLTPSNRESLAQTAALFPDAFQTSEIGEIPLGWTMGHLSDHARIEMGQSPSGDTYNDRGDGVPLVNGPVEFGPYFAKRSKWTTSPTKLSDEGDLIVCVRGSTTGRYVKSDGTYCLGRGVCSLRGTRSQAFVDHLFKRSRSRLLELTTGSTFPNWSGQTLRSFQVICPNESVIRAFDLCLAPLVVMQGAHDKQSCTLAQLRDTLLPKLLSGELSVPATQTKTEEPLT